MIGSVNADSLKQLKQKLAKDEANKAALKAEQRRVESKRSDYLDAVLLKQGRVSRGEEIWIDQIQIHEHHFSAFFCHLKRQIYGIVAFAATVMTAYYIELSFVHALFPIFM